MAFNYSPKIVTDGLVLCLDAANPRSYVSGSTTWNDISRGGNNGTLTNGPTFSSANGGSIIFDGSNDYNTVSTFSILTGSFSCECFFQWASLGNGVGSLFSLNYQFPTTGYLIRQRDDSSGRFVVWSDNGTETSVFSTRALTTNTWNHVIVVQSAGNCSIYINGTLDSSQALANPVLNQSYPILIGIRATSGPSVGAYLTGRIALSRIYNRALNATEVLQNYNATKTRFGLT